jgi:hypothetical protein
MRSNEWTRMLVYSAGIGDDMVLDGNPEIKCTQETKCTPCSFFDRNLTSRLSFFSFPKEEGSGADKKEAELEKVEEEDLLADNILLEYEIEENLQEGRIT